MFKGNEGMRSLNGDEYFKERSKKIEKLGYFKIADNKNVVLWENKNDETKGYIFYKDRKEFQQINLDETKGSFSLE